MSTLQRWAFMPDELDNLETCRADDEFTAYPPAEELGVIVYRNGDVSNRWADGTAGIPDDVREIADDEDTLYRDAEEIEGWRNVEVDDNGRPVRIIPEEVTA